MKRQSALLAMNAVFLCAWAAPWAVASHMDEESRKKYTEGLERSRQDSLKQEQNWRQQASDARYRCQRFNVGCGTEAIFDALAGEAFAKSERIRQELLYCETFPKNCGHHSKPQEVGQAPMGMDAEPRQETALRKELLGAMKKAFDIAIRLQPDPDRKADLEEALADASIDLFLAFAGNCPDLSGRWTYTESSGQVDTITIRQEGCTTLYFETDWFHAFVGMKLAADGSEHYLGRLGPESGRLAGCDKYRLAYWEGNFLRVRTRLQCSFGLDSGEVHVALIGPDALEIGLHLGGGKTPSVSTYRRDRR